VTRAAVLRDATLTTAVGQFAVIQAVAPSLGVEVSPVGVLDAGEIERAVTTFAHGSNGGLIVTGSPLFASVVDPVGGGFVDSLARPGGNTTGFTLFEWFRPWRRVRGRIL
jgi:hypothetical protein